MNQSPFNPAKHVRETKQRQIMHGCYTNRRKLADFLEEINQILKVADVTAKDVNISFSGQANAAYITLTVLRVETNEELTTRLGADIACQVIERERQVEQEKYKTEYMTDMQELQRLNDKWRHRKVPYDGPDSI